MPAFRGLRLGVALSVLLFVSPFLVAQTDLLSIIRVRVDHETPLRVGATVQGRMIDDYFVHDALAAPRGTFVVGKVTGVKPVSRRARLDAMSHGDFTPLQTAEIQFDELRFSDGTTMRIDATDATAASEIVRFYSRGTQRRSMLRQVWSSLLGRKNAAVKAVKAPGKKDRLEDLFYRQLPWHPQEIEQGTVYEVTLHTPVEARGSMPRRSTTPGVSQQATLRARLTSPLDSARAKQGDAVEAVVTAPAFDPQQQIEVPQGSTLHGHVLKSKAAGRFGRGGTLRFTFDRLDLPEGTQQQVNGVASAIDSTQARELSLDNEGGVEPSANKSVLAPLALGFLAASALTEDEAAMGHAATSSNGFGLIARAVAIGTKSNIFGGVLGIAATARTVYSRFIAHGKDVKFDRGTEIEVDLGPSKKPMGLKVQ